jgi:F-type H+-transporting ATPase subunit b
MQCLIGINTNLIETNVVNLAIVLTIVVIFVGDEITLILDRRQSILIANVTAAIDIERRLTLILTQSHAALAKYKRYEERVSAEISKIFTQEKCAIKARLDEQQQLLQTEIIQTVKQKHKDICSGILSHLISIACVSADNVIVSIFRHQSTESQVHKRYNSQSRYIFWESNISLNLR